ncbi:hypothetical protein [Streptomyces sp. NPDC002853]
MAADDEHLDAVPVRLVANSIDGQRGGGAQKMGHSGGEPGRGIVEVVRGLEHLRDDLPGAGIGGVLAAQSFGRFAGLVGASCVPERGDAESRDEVGFVALGVQDLLVQSEGLLVLACAAVEFRGLGEEFLLVQGVLPGQGLQFLRLLGVRSLDGAGLTTRVTALTGHKTTLSAKRRPYGAPAAAQDGRLV